MLGKIALILTIVGGINWGLIGGDLYSLRYGGKIVRLTYKKQKAQSLLRLSFFVLVFTVSWWFLLLKCRLSLTLKQLRWATKM